jgi:hypothetical protein
MKSLCLSFLIVMGFSFAQAQTHLETNALVEKANKVLAKLSEGQNSVVKKSRISRYANTNPPQAAQKKDSKTAN